MLSHSISESGCLNPSGKQKCHLGSKILPPASTEWHPYWSTAEALSSSKVRMPSVHQSTWSFIGSIDVNSTFKYVRNVWRFVLSSHCMHRKFIKSDYHMRCRSDESTQASWGATIQSRVRCLRFQTSQKGLLELLLLLPQPLVTPPSNEEHKQVWTQQWTPAIFPCSGDSFSTPWHGLCQATGCECPEDAINSGAK